MNEKQIPNPFADMGAAGEPKKRGRPATKSPVGEQKTAKTPVGKSDRKPVGLRGINKTPVREGYKRRWVNDTEDRIQMFLDGGYSKVSDDNGVTRERRAGGGVNSILMEIDEDTYLEDQNVKYSQWNKDNQERLKPREGTGYYQPKSKL